MTIVAHAHSFVIGVDTHARTHTLAVLAAATGELVATDQFPTTDAGLHRAVSWAARRTGGELSALWVIEGVASYGARLAATVGQAGFEVVEAARMDARAHRGTGKSDPLDARRIAAAVLSLEPQQLRRPRSDDGVRAALRVLVTARDHMTTERTATVNALTALLRVAAFGIDARKSLTARQIGEITRWRSRVEDVATVAARAEASRLAKRVVALTSCCFNERVIERNVATTTGIQADEGKLYLCAIRDEHSRVLGCRWPTTCAPSLSRKRWTLRCSPAAGRWPAPSCTRTGVVRADSIGCRNTGLLEQE